jgi:hypothetical protein
MSQPWIYLKYVGAWVIRVNNPQMFPHCARIFIHTGLDKKTSFQGVDNLKMERTSVTVTKICHQVTKMFIPLGY